MFKLICMKKLFILTFFFSFAVFHQPVLAAYPSGCSLQSQSILNAVGGCLAIDCNSYTSICGKCCEENIQTVACSDFIYTDWSVCQLTGIQTRTVVYRSPEGCVGGPSVTSQVCVLATTTQAIIPTVSTASLTLISTTTVFSITTFIPSKNDIASGEVVNLEFSGTNNISKYILNFTCPKFSTGPGKGLSAASVLIEGVDYCNYDFVVPTNLRTQNILLINKAPKSIKINIRLRAYNSQDQYVSYKDLGINVQNQIVAPVPVASTTPSLATSTVGVTPEYKPAPFSATDTLPKFTDDFFKTKPSTEIATTTSEKESIISLFEIVKNIFISIFRFFGFGK